LKEPIETLYIGGGTPSLLTPKQLRLLFSQIENTFSLNRQVEMTIEANPESLSKPTLHSYREMGINRLSIGVQSFDDQELSLLGRSHSATDAEEQILLAHQVGFDRIGIDLMFGLPGQSKETWVKTLNKTLSFAPTHISSYSLTWSNATLLGKMIETKKIPRPDDDTTAEMYLLCHDILTEAGYEHYEISNFAAPGYRCLHNEGYWTGKTYIGLGPSAHSFIGNKRFWNCPDVKRYIHVLSQNQLATAGEERLNPDQRYLEKIALGLRRIDGVPLRLLEDRKEKVSQLVRHKLARIENNHLILNVRGFLVADEVVLKLAS
jgi:oxygen-independent coproporphyrinogen-3 oxidase